MNLLHKTRAWLSLLTFTLTVRRAVRLLKRRADAGADVRDDAGRLGDLIAEARRSVAEATTTPN